MNEISVIIPAYNPTVEELSRSISSVIIQSNVLLEVIVIDDCSRLELVSIIESKFDDSRIRVIRNKVNLGVGESRNIGLRNSQYRYVAFLDADDFWITSNKCQMQVDDLHKNNAVLSYTDYSLSDGTEYMAPLSLSFKELKRCNYIGCSTVVLDKNKLLDYSLFPNMPRRQDWLAWLRIARTLGSKSIVKTEINSTMYKVGGGISQVSIFRLLIDTMEIYEKLDYNYLGRLAMLCQFLLFQTLKKLLRFRRIVDK